MRSLALVTGASSGIGLELARQLAAAGHDLVLVARRIELLQQLAETLSSTCNVTVDVVAADLADPAGLQRVLEAIGDRPFDVVANNAGGGWIGPFSSSPAERQLEIVDINCRALVAITRAVLPGMLARRRGRLLQVASVAGFMPGPLASTYYASKAFVVSHSEALRHELAGSGVTITVSCPGPVATEFQRRAGVRGSVGEAAAMPADVVAADSLAALFAGRFLVVPGPANLLLVVAARVLPRRLSAWLVARVQRARLSS
ncbi:MAG TPA: SDR family oxidoreductase [Myxococcota bacterium]